MIFSSSQGTEAGVVAGGEATAVGAEQGVLARSIRSAKPKRRKTNQKKTNKSKLSKRNGKGQKRRGKKLGRKGKGWVNRGKKAARKGKKIPGEGQKAAKKEQSNKDSKQVGAARRDSRAEEKFGDCEFIDLVEAGTRKKSGCGPGMKFLMKVGFVYILVLLFFFALFIFYYTIYCFITFSVPLFMFFLVISGSCSFLYSLIICSQ